MKLAITLIIIGILLIIDGTFRIVEGAMSGITILVVGGLLNGLDIGWLFGISWH